MIFFSLLANALFIADDKGNLIPAPSMDAFPLPPTGDYGMALVKMFLTLAAIIALFFLSYWFLKRLIQNRSQKGADDRSIKILEKRMLSSKTILYLVEVDNKKTLLAESQLEIKKLESFPTEFERGNPQNDPPP